MASWEGRVIVLGALLEVKVEGEGTILARRSTWLNERTLLLGLDDVFIPT